MKALDARRKIAALSQKILLNMITREHPWNKSQKNKKNMHPALRVCHWQPCTQSKLLSVELNCLHYIIVLSSNIQSTV